MQKTVIIFGSFINIKILPGNFNGVTNRGFGFVQMAGGLAAVGEIDPRLDQRRIKFDRAFICRNSFLVAFQTAERQPVTQPRARHFRLQAHGLFARFQVQRELAKLIGEFAQHEPRFAEIGFDRDGKLQFTQRIRRTVLLPVNKAKIIARVGALRLLYQRRTIKPFGFGQIIGDGARRRLGRGENRTWIQV